MDFKVMFLCLLTFALFDRVSSLLDFTSGLGLSVGSAKTLFAEYNADRRWAKLLLEISNYSKMRLEHCCFTNVKGEISNSFLGVGSGTTEAMFAHQALLAGSSEGLLHCQVDGLIHGQGTHCMLYWRIQSRQTPRIKPNMIGIGCQENLDEAEQVEMEIKERGEKAVKEYLKYTYSRSTIEKIQHCEADFCIQAIMPSSNQPTVDVDILPVLVEDWADNSKDEVTQADIDQMIVVRNTTAGEDGKGKYNQEVIGIITGAIIGAIVISAVVIGGMVCLCKRMRN